MHVQLFVSARRSNILPRCIYYISPERMLFFMVDGSDSRKDFKEKEFSYCFNTAEPVKVVVRNNNRQAYKLEDSCYERYKSQYPKGL